MTRIIVETIDDMPGEPGKRGGLPLGCILETDGNRVVAFGPGSTWSEAGLGLISPDVQTFTAIFPDDSECENPPVKVRAVDLRAALQWLGRHFHGPFDLHVDAAPVYLGEFE